MKLVRALRRIFSPARKRPDASEQLGICLLPWLVLNDPVAFAGVRLERWSSVRGGLPADVRATADLVVSGFRDNADNVVDPAVCWFSEGEPIAPISEEDAEALRERVFLLALAAIASNRYLSHRPQVNATHFARVYQNFTPGTETVALIRRRRDGQTISAGHQLAQLRFPAPAAATERTTPSFDRAFLDALATCIDANDDASVLVRQSLPLFIQGNELDEFETHGQDVVWIASAIEQVCDVSGRNKDTQMAARLADLLGGDWTDDQKRVVRRWMREFYAKRSEIHGEEATTDRWPYWTHALIGTVAYVALIKHLLAAAGRFELTDRDRDDAAGLPHRIECLIEADTRPQEDFARCWHEGQYEGAMRRIFRRFGL